MQTEVPLSLFPAHRRAPGFGAAGAVIDTAIYSGVFIGIFLVRALLDTGYYLGIHRDGEGNSDLLPPGPQLAKFS
jgi:hypothetical protein